MLGCISILQCHVLYATRLVSGMVNLAVRQSHLRFREQHTDLGQDDNSQGFEQRQPDEPASGSHRGGLLTPLCPLTQYLRTVWGPPRPIAGCR
jgi:hypothetical protein